MMKNKIEIGNQIRQIGIQVSTPKSRQASMQERFQQSPLNERGVPSAIKLKGKRKFVAPSSKRT